MASQPWSEVRLGDLVSIKHGWPFKSELCSSDHNGGPIVVNIGNFRYTGGFRFDETTVREYRGEYPREFELSPSEILLVMTCQTAGGEILGIPARVPHNGRVYLHNQRMGRVVVKRPDLVDADYLYWLFLWSEFNRELFVSASGTKILHTAPSRIEAFRFRLPALAEQRAIAHVLGALDDKIELSRRMNQTLEAMAQAIFKSWFVDFDPVRAKAAGQVPLGLEPEIAALFPDGFGQSDIDEIPAGWNRIPIFELAEINACTLGKNDELDRIEYIQISEVSRGDIGSIEVFERGEEPSRARRRLRRGDTVMSTVRPDRGSYFLCLHPSPYSIASTGFAVITPTRAPWSFIHTAITKSEVFEHLGQQADGGAYPAISPEIIGKWQVTWPDQSAIVGAFHKMCGALYELAEENRRQSRTLAKLRDALLPNLLSSELRVSENQTVAEM